ncbi:MAG: hypothetical protein JO117_06045 [Verrucomicrobia bacterium]|nr:hypothetical protein [Verrucomicrobiota bacterium]
MASHFLNRFQFTFLLALSLSLLPASVPKSVAVELNPFQEGLKAYRQADYQRAAACFNESLSLHLQPYTAHYLRGVCLLQLHDFNGALADAAAAAQLKPGEGAPWNLRHSALVKKHDQRGATAAVEHAVRLAPNNALYHNNLA